MYRINYFQHVHPCIYHALINPAKTLAYKKKERHREGEWETSQRARDIYLSRLNSGLNLRPSIGLSKLRITCRRLYIYDRKVSSGSSISRSGQPLKENGTGDSVSRIYYVYERKRDRSGHTERVSMCMCVGERERDSRGDYFCRIGDSLIRLPRRSEQLTSSDWALPMGR